MSKKILITQLGRSNRNEGKYRSARYQFEDQSVSDPATFLGWVLLEKVAPERLVIMGTNGSMWDNLFELDLDFGDSLEEERLALQDACLNECVTQKQLDALQQPLAEKLGIAEVHLQLISYCRNEKQQVALLKTMSKFVGQGDEVHLDVTHGFRHLPMLGMLSALYLRQTKQATIAKIYYGALDMTKEGKTPVLDLTGLLKMADWVGALGRYDKDGDYGEFSELLGEGNEQLAEAAFFERTTNPVKAREKLSSWHSQKNLESQSSIAKLFIPELEERVKWFKGKDRAAWEKSLAYEYLAKEDFVRAVMYAVESAISQEVIQKGGKLNDFEQRKQCSDAMRESVDGFKKLSRVRNAFAHGVNPDDNEIKKMISDAKILGDTLKSLFKTVLERE